MSYVPGTDRKTFDLLWREAGTQDFEQVLRIVRLAGWRPSPQVLGRFITQIGWTVRLALRSKSSIVGLYAGEFLATGASKLRCFWTHPDYADSKLPLRLLQLARLELPEQPTVISVPADDARMQDVLIKLGAISATEIDAERYDYHLPSVAGANYKKAVGTAGREKVKKIRKTSDQPKKAQP